MNLNKPTNILLTSVGRRGYLVRYFQEAIKGNGKIHAANSSVSPALEMADKSVITPLIYDDSYIPFLLKYCEDNEITAVISLFDIDLPILAHHKADFEKIGVKVIVSDPEVVNICNDKWEMYSFLKENGFDILTTFVHLKDALKAIKDNQMKFPVMVKPRWGMGSIAIYEAENIKELEVLYERVKREIFRSYLKYESRADAESSIIIQEKANGQEYGLDNISDLMGNYCTTVVKKKEGMRSGETDSATTVNMPELMLLGKRLATFTNHIANMDIDVIVSKDKIYILDMNARFGGGYPFSHMAGVNLPMAIVKWLWDEEVPFSMLTPEMGVTSQKDIQLIKLKSEFRKFE